MSATKSVLPLLNPYCVLAFVYACMCVCAHMCVCVYIDLCGNGEFQPRRRLCLGLPREVEAIAMLVPLREMGSKRTFLSSSLCDLGQVTSVP
uniref:Secreted protein n=1 Tax=Macaca nemestrina TaxID=9545 RepID=A0A2K6CN15_MACNE